MRSFVNRRLPRLQLVVVGVLIALILPATWSSSQVDAQTGEQLSGMQGSARASGIFVHYNLGGVLPISSPIDSSAPDAHSTISSGPSTFAQAAVFNPGDLLANPDVLFQNGAPGWEPGTIPPYPYRVTARSGFGEPAADSNPGPGLQARVEATERGSSAVASAGRSETPSILTTGAVTTTSTSSTDGATVTVDSVTEVTDFNLLGMLSIDSIVTETTATSDGKDVVLSGSSSIGRATLGGQEVVIDGEGIHPERPNGSGSLLGGVLPTVSQQLSDLLTEAGITITAGGMVEQDGTDTGSIAATGLRIEIDITGRTAPVLGEALGLIGDLDLPPIDGAPIQVADVLEVVRGRNITQIEIAGSRADLAATLAPEFPTFTLPPTPPASPATPSGPSSPSFTPTPAAPVSGAPTPDDDVAAPTPTASSPASQVTVALLAPGVGVALVIALLAQPILGLLLRRWTEAILAPAGAAGGPCPLESSDV